MNALRLLVGVSILLSGCIAIDPEEIGPDTDATLSFFDTRLTRNPTYIRMINFVLESLMAYHLPIELGYGTINSDWAGFVSQRYSGLIWATQSQLNRPQRNPGEASNDVDGLNSVLHGYMSNCVGDSYKCRKVLVASYAILLASQPGVQRANSRQMLANVLEYFRHRNYHSIWKGIFLSFYFRGLRRFVNLNLITQPRFDEFVGIVLNEHRIDAPILGYIVRSLTNNNQPPMAPGADSVQSPTTYHRKFVEELIQCSELIPWQNDPRDLAQELMCWILDVSQHADQVLGIVTPALTRVIDDACTRQINRR